MVIRKLLHIWEGDIILENFKIHSCASACKNSCCTSPVIYRATADLAHLLRWRSLCLINVINNNNNNNNNNLFAGMWQSSELLLSRTCTRQPIPPEALQILPPPGRKSSTQTFPAVTPSNHWHLRRWAHSVLHYGLFDRTWSSAISVHWRTARDCLNFFFSVCLSLFKLQRFNAVLIQETFDLSDCQPDL